MLEHIPCNPRVLSSNWEQPFVMIELPYEEHGYRSKEAVEYSLGNGSSSIHLSLNETF